MADQQIIIYHIEGRRSFRVVWTCEELGLPYQLIFREGDIMGSLQEMRAAFPPLPMCPVVKYGDQWLVESGGIVEALIARDPGQTLVPDRLSPDYPAHAQWMHFAEGTVLSRVVYNRMSAQAQGLNVKDLPGYRAATYSPSDPPRMIGNDAVFDFVASYLEQHAYFGGAQFSGADIMMHYSLRLSQWIAGLDYAAYPAIAYWVARVESRPAFSRASLACTPGGSDAFGMPLSSPLPMAPQR